MDEITIAAASRPYRVLVASGLIDHVGKIITESFAGARCAIISDATVAHLFADRVRQSLISADLKSILIAVPAGEKSKSLEQVGSICDQMTAAGLDRSSFVIALGGGVVGDIAGFVAAIYHRGIPYVQVPTTLLAQVDSSIGGKTAVNTGAGKNLIGAVHHPALVISDVDSLRTLPPRELNQGFAETIKHAVICDAELFESLAKFGRQIDLESLVRRNVEIKAEFVAADERDENGRRALLNFGHTVGHAIEQAGDYRELLHGEAVSLGIVAACDISVRKAALPETHRSRIIALLQQFDLPTRLPSNISRDRILHAIPFDKKFDRGRVRFVVTPKIGTARLTSDVTMDDIREAVSRL
jgi:3-dehydroquinate synthase